MLPQTWENHDYSSFILRKGVSSVLQLQKLYTAYEQARKFHELSRKGM